MRLWTLHPRYLDSQGLVALWREGLLAQKVLRGLTRGYRQHPQLERFRELDDAVAGIAAYLAGVHAEALRRSYHFDEGKIAAPRLAEKMTATTGQLAFELEHLRRKLAVRDPAKFAELATLKAPEPHPLFRVVDGGVASWEKARAE